MQSIYGIQELKEHADIANKALHKVQHFDMVRVGKGILTSV